MNDLNIEFVETPTNDNEVNDRLILTEHEIIRFQDKIVLIACTKLQLILFICFILSLLFLFFQFGQLYAGYLALRSLTVSDIAKHRNLYIRLQKMQI